MTTRLPLKGGDILLLIIAGIAALATIGAAVLFLRDGANGVVVLAAAAMVASTLGAFYLTRKDRAERENG